MVRHGFGGHASSLALSPPPQAPADRFSCPTSCGYFLKKIDTGSNGLGGADRRLKLPLVGYNSLMRFWLRWAVVTLPVVVCLFLWARSYLVQEDFYRQGFHNELSLGSSRGVFFVAFLRTGDWNITGGRWSYHTSIDLEDTYGYVGSNKYLGFGYLSRPFPAGGSTTFIFIQLPMWAIALLLIVPPLWLYRRQRRRRTTGFPLAPLDSETTSSA